MAEPISSRAAKALFTVWSASQTGDPNDLEAPLKGLESLRDRGLLIEWSGNQGGRFFLVTHAGKQVLRSTPPASLRD